jgi:predicted ester cyclase
VAAASATIMVREHDNVQGVRWVFLPSVGAIALLIRLSVSAFCHWLVCQQFRQQYPLKGGGSVIPSLLAFALIVVCLPASSSGQSRATGESSAAQKMVLSYFQDVLDHDKEELLEKLFLPDCAIHRPEGELKGIATLHKMAQVRRATYSTFSSEVHDIFESGDRVVVRLTHKAQGAGPVRFRIGTHDVSGKTVTWDAIVIFRMQNGKIAEEWVSRDELGMLLSAGVLEEKVGPR